jgi:MFS family permease
MQSTIIAILSAGLAGWVFGAIWYTSLGKPWQRAHGLNPEECKDQKMPLTPLLVALLGAIVMAAVLHQVLTSLGVMGVAQGAIAGLTLGAGFLFIATMVNNQFQQKNWVATLNDGGHWSLVLMIEGAVITALA